MSVSDRQNIYHCTWTKSTLVLLTIVMVMSDLPSRCEGSENAYTIEFEFDSDVACRFTVYTRVPDTVDSESLRNG